MTWIMWNKLKGRDCTPKEQARMEAWIRQVKAEEKKEAANKKKR